MLLLLFIPGSWLKKRRSKILFYSLTVLVTGLLLFGAIAEGFFWEEFNTRFNFIAVDYLIYTTEVIGNIQQSYPLEIIIPLIISASALITFLLRKNIQYISVEAVPFRKRLRVFAMYMLVPVSSLLLSSGNKNLSDNTYVNEIAGNGLYELFSAYRNNELDYETFYKKDDIKSAFQLVRTMLQTPEATYLSKDVFNLERTIHHEQPEKKLNVVLISVESFSASFMKAFGNEKGITPHLDSLANHSLFFTNLYATGTRTVRGLEALSLAIPPTPGQSIVRRPDNEGMFTLGSVFNSKGYDCKFIYGGYGYFDNMNYFFENNSYEAIDRVAIADDRIHFENVWGVADEDLFDFAKEEMDKSAKNKKPFFTHIMTTSNHRPFTYPEGRIDIPSHTGRSGAVKYTDYSIDKLLKDCEKEPWFDSTVFVIVADHCASSAGETDLPVDKYHIPMMIYSPKNIEPQKVDYLMSQIDVAPTILGLLNFNYTSKFFGYDIFQTTPTQRRVFVSTYQLLGYMKGEDLIVLTPQQKTSQYHVDSKSYETHLMKSQNTALVNEAVDWYEAASYSFKHHLSHYQ
jgi:phosphoglycerol transferase MdoB-like AlkP superfamily enzyme